MHGIVILLAAAATLYESDASWIEGTWRSSAGLSAKYTLAEKDFEEEMLEDFKESYGNYTWRFHQGEFTESWQGFEPNPTFSYTLLPMDNTRYELKLSKGNTVLRYIIWKAEEGGLCGTFYTSENVDVMQEEQPVSVMCFAPGPNGSQPR
ncbi:MAG: hypothetical protein NXH95_03195 [Pseudomonadaceae bacterium]|nr:hypothetical protein [Pseudomonadaceae bacterium]